MSTKVKTYLLKPTERIPNSPYPLLHYPGYFDADAGIAQAAFDTFNSNGWQTQWIYRYGHTQAAHYHSTAHECMAVLSGHAIIRFGVADISPDLEENTEGLQHETGGVEVHVSAGDVFVIPAGVSHKTYGTEPKAEFALLSRGDGSSIEDANPRESVASTRLDGFTMLGAYPTGSHWDFQTNGTEQKALWGRVWGIARPPSDPLLGDSAEGLCGLWQDS